MTLYRCFAWNRDARDDGGDGPLWFPADRPLSCTRVATRNRSVTQPQALDLYGRHPNVAGLQWWSSWEALWMNVTVFDRAAPRLRLIAARELTLEHPVFREAADLFGLRSTQG